MNERINDSSVMLLLDMEDFFLINESKGVRKAL